MRIFLRLLVYAFASLAMTVVGAQAAVTVGEQAPDFAAADTVGRQHSLSAYRGNFVVLEWFNPDCPFVRKHYGRGNMQRLQKKYTAEGVIWLSVCSSAEGKQGYYNPQELSRLMEEKGAGSTAVIQDADGTIGRMYGAKTTPHIFIMDPQGLLIYQGAIDSIAGMEPEEIAQAQNYVAAALDAARNGEPVGIPSTPSYGCSVKY